MKVGVSNFFLWWSKQVDNTDIDITTWQIPLLLIIHKYLLQLLVWSKEWFDILYNCYRTNFDSGKYSRGKNDTYLLILPNTNYHNNTELPYGETKKYPPDHDFSIQNLTVFSNFIKKYLSYEKALYLILKP